MSSLANILASFCQPQIDNKSVFVDVAQVTIEFKVAVYSCILFLLFFSSSYKYRQLDGN